MKEEEIMEIKRFIEDLLNIKVEYVSDPLVYYHFFYSPRNVMFMVHDVQEMYVDGVRIDSGICIYELRKVEIVDVDPNKIEAISGGVYIVVTIYVLSPWLTTFEKHIFKVQSPAP